MEVKVPGAGGLTHGQTISFTFVRSDGKEAAGFVIKVKDTFKAYYNRCNHWPVNLDQGDEDFYYEKIDRITCKSHGATYQLGDGYCDTGPCAGSYLRGFEIMVTGDEAVVNTGDL